MRLQVTGKLGTWWGDPAVVIREVGHAALGCGALAKPD